MCWRRPGGVLTAEKVRSVADAGAFFRAGRRRAAAD
jgi:hypothetical protein